MKFLRLTLFLVFFHGSLDAQITSSFYVSVADSTKLAVDVNLPDNYKEGKLPVLVVFTRYWRSSVDRKTGEAKSPFGGLDRYFSENGYVIVKVDVRGSGASFGTRQGEYTPTEVMDAKLVLDWIIGQSWCDGNIGSYGTSYEGTTAELLCATKHPAVKAVIPGWSDFDVYRSPVRPYGMLASGFIKKWGQYVWLLDHDFSRILKGSIRPVDQDSLKNAISEHKENPKIFKLTKNAEYRNSRVGQYTYAECSPLHWKDEIEESNVPMLVLTSWMDAGTAEGTLLRLQHFSNSQKVVMMATSHGGWSHASTFVASDVALYPRPTKEEQNNLQLRFFDHYLKEVDKGVEDWPMIRYYNLGEEKFRESDIWPVKGASEVNYYFQKNRGLDRERPVNEKEVDDYKVDFSVSTGKQNRWTTQMGGPVLNLNNRNDEDSRMLTYTSAPMDTDLQITGTPMVSLEISSTHTDGAVFVYLEDVDENGNSRYLTEGGLRLIHRKISDSTDSKFNMHSFDEEDAMLLEPGTVELVTFKLWPTSVLIQKGHSIRVAIAGADKDTFDKIPKKGKPTLTVHRNSVKASFIQLPVIEAD